MMLKHLVLGYLTYSKVLINLNLVLYFIIHTSFNEYLF